MEILLIDPFPENMLAALRDTGSVVRYHPEYDRIQVLEALRSAEVLILNSKVNVDEELVAHAPLLRLVCRAGVGMDHFDLAALEKRGIAAFNTPGANADPVAEQTVGMMLALLHHLVRASAQVKRFEWKREENRGSELQTRTVGIIGYGNIGSAVAKRLAGFGCRMLAYDKYRTGFGTGMVEECSYEKLIAESDIITFHVPLTPETNGWADDAFFARLPRPVYLLNLARGQVVHIPALNAALRTGKVMGAALDVLPNEKLDRLTPDERAQYEELFSFDNVILTPHIGGWSHESLDRINFRIVDEVKRLVAEGSRAK